MLIHFWQHCWSTSDFLFIQWFSCNLKQNVNGYSNMVVMNIHIKCGNFPMFKSSLWPKSSDFSVVQQGYRRFPRLPGGAVITDVFIQPSAAHMTRSSGLNLSNNVTLNASLHQRTEEVMFFFIVIKWNIQIHTGHYVPWWAGKIDVTLFKCLLSNLQI